MNLNATDLERLRGLLDRVEPGYLPPDIFQSIARILVTTTLVVVPILNRRDRTYVLLNRRSPDDLCYPGMLNAPGTVFRPTDNSIQHAYARLREKEFPDAVLEGDFVFVGNFFQTISRGKEVSLVYWIPLHPETNSPDLYDVAALPSTLVATDLQRIEGAATHFTNYRRARSK